MTTTGNITNCKKEKGSREIKFMSDCLAKNIVNSLKKLWEMFGEMCLSNIKFINLAKVLDKFEKNPESATLLKDLLFSNWRTYLL
jgi:hypothetical protein